MTGDPVEPDPARPHAFVAMQLARHPGCAVCGNRATAPIHLISPGPCPDCARPLDINGDCPAGCNDDRWLDADHRDRPTSRNRFGGRNR